MKSASEREVAALVGASLQTVQSRRKSGGFPKSCRKDRRGRYRYDPVLALQEWEAFAPLRVKNAAAAGDQDAWREARSRRERAEAEIAEIKLTQRKGELLVARDVEDRMVALFTSCKTKLLGIPSRARQADPALTETQITLIEQLVREALDDLGGGAAEGAAA